MPIAAQALAARETRNSKKEYRNAEFALQTETLVSPGPASFLTQVAGVFASPSRTFESITRSPRFFAPFFATLLVIAGFWGVVYLRLGLSGMAVAVMQDLRRGTLVGQDETDFALHFLGNLATLVVIAGLIAILLHLLVIAWAGARISDLLLGGRMRFRVAFSVTCYAYFAKTLAQTVFGLPMIFFGDVNGLNFGNLIPTNIAFFLDPKDTSRMLYALLESLDILQAWYFILLGIGMSRRSDDKAGPWVMAAGLGGFWIVVSLLFAAIRDLLLKS